MKWNATGQFLDLNKTLVTASSPVIVSINRQDSVAAVVGLQMQYRTFYELFMQSTKLCDDDSDTGCNYTCHSDVSLLPFPPPPAVTHTHVEVWIIQCIFSDVLRRKHGR